MDSVSAGSLVYTLSNNPVNLQYVRHLNSHENFTCLLHDLMCMLLSVTVQGVESTVEDVETKVNPVNLKLFSIEDFLIGTLI